MTTLHLPCFKKGAQQAERKASNSLTAPFLPLKAPRGSLGNYVECLVTPDDSQAVTGLQPPDKKHDNHE